MNRWLTIIPFMGFPVLVYLIIAHDLAWHNVTPIFRRSSNRLDCESCSECR